MSQMLDEIRKKIDALDDRIHDLLMERADLIVGVTEEKKKHNIPVVQPAREAKMIRRLLKRHRGPLPEAAIVGIWRELVGAVSLLQTGLKVSVGSNNGETSSWDMAKDYFGSVLPMVKAQSPVMAVSAVRENEANFAVVPWPQDGEKAPWWPHLISSANGEDNKMRIVIALPYGMPEILGSGMQNRSLVISRTDFAPSGEDHSFLALEIDPTVSRAKIVDVFKDAGLKLLTLNTLGGAGVSGRTLHFIEVDNYITDGADQIKTAVEKFPDTNARIIPLGGYPVPPVYSAKKPESLPMNAEKKTGTKNV